MSEINMTRHDHILVGLFSSLQAAAMQQMGKIQNPMTQEVERDMTAAASTIDILDMLKVKCRTDTPEELLRFMDAAVADLQMNFVDEQKKDSAKAPASEAKENDNPENDVAENDAAQTDAAEDGESADGAAG